MNHRLWKNLRSLGSILLVLLLLLLIPSRSVCGVPANFVKVPNVLNIKKDQALVSLKNAGLSGTVTNLPVDDPKYNLMVKMQSHKPGDLIPKGTVVTLTVLQYVAPPSNLVRVPNVLNILKDQAETALKNAGLNSFVSYLPVDNAKYNLMVKMQSHKPGDMIQKGTVVTITVLRFPK
jgi:beta-lactam-binding protein with PASTA domain